jgi:hypothetical protein
VAATSEQSFTGGCGCGGVRWELAAPPTQASYCHCTRCRRRTGTGVSLGAAVPPGALTITSGEDLIRTWDPGGGWLKAFCGSCGSALYSQDPEDPARVSMRMGGFDEDPGVPIAYHQFTAYAPAWAPVPDDGLPRYPERAPADARGPG